MAVKVGDTVSVEYVGTLDDGSVFDKSDVDPLRFEVGSGQVIKGFDEAVIGMELEESKKVKIPPEEAYGPRDDKLVMEVPREKFPPEFSGNMGEIISMQTENGQRLIATVVKADDKVVLLDLNHPMAGKTLNFEIKVVKIESR